MRLTVAISASLAALAAASPLLAKKKLVYDIVTETVIVYVTAGDEPITSLPVATSTLVFTTTSTPQVVSTPPAVQTPAPVVSAAAISVPAPTSTPQPSTVPATPTSVDLAKPTDYKSTVLYYHNIHRANNSADPLTYDDKLAGYALTVASTCVFAHDLTPGNGGYGQNIADSGTNDVNEKNKNPNNLIATAISAMWYTGEISQFPDSDYGKPNPDFANFENWGHYTQVVWKSTKTVGCATVYCGSNVGTMFGTGWSGWYSVCNYGPAGNMGGGYGDNVGRPLGHPTIST